MLRSIFYNRHISEARKIIKSSNKIFVFTGAGISASSGIPTFRDKNSGLWTNDDVAKFGDPQTWDDQPKECWTAYEKFRSLTNAAVPTNAHNSLKVLTELKNRTVIVTTNVDSLHSKSGAPAYEMHGSLNEAKCKVCSNKIMLPDTIVAEQPRCECGGLYRHDVVLWGEEVRYTDVVYRAASCADCIILIGASGVVTDTHAMTKIAKASNKPVIEINSNKTHSSDLVDIFIKMNADEALQKLIS